MSNWKNKKLILGSIKENTKKLIYFEATDDIKDIDRFKPGCGCTKIEYDKRNKLLKVVFKPGSVPNHLRDKGEYTTTKFINVYYTDNTVDELMFKITIKCND